MKEKGKRAKEEEEEESEVWAANVELLLFSQSEILTAMH